MEKKFERVVFDVRDSQRDIFDEEDGRWQSSILIVEIDNFNGRERPFEVTITVADGLTERIVQVRCPSGRVFHVCRWRAMRFFLDMGMKKRDILDALGMAYVDALDRQAMGIDAYEVQVKKPLKGAII